MDKRCPYCGGEIRDGKCTNCGAVVSEQDQVDAEDAPKFERIPASSDPAGDGAPWERMKELGFFNALIENARQMILSPSDFYKKMGKSGGYGMPLLYAIIFGAVGGIVGEIWALLMESLNIAPLAMFGMGKETSALSGQMAFGMLGTVFGIIFIPIAVTITAFVQAGIYHLMLMILGGAEEDFETTFRVVAYSKTAEIARIVPFLGGLVTTVWEIVLCIDGLREAHNIENKTAVLAVLLPFLLCCVLIGLLAMLFGGALLTMIGSAAKSGF